MKRTTRPCKYIFGLSVIFTIVCFWSCGGGSKSSDDYSPDTGTLAFKIAYHNAGSNLISQLAEIDCAGQGIATVEAAIHDRDNAFLAGGGPWDCDMGQGTITSVPAGSGRTIVILGKDSDEKIVFHGQKADIDVAANSQNNAGIIDCYAFVPILQAPADGEVVEAGAIELEWQEVSGATDYLVVVSETDNLTPTIEEDTPVESYAPLGLSIGKPYHWQIFAVDAYKNIGIGSEIRSMTIIAGTANTSPVAKIISPAEADIFTASDTIVFSGDGRDSEDGVLSGESLVWTSDLDGLIGTGEMFSSGILVAGSHLITLTATDSEGASTTDSVVINIPPGTLPDTGQITFYTDALDDGEDADYLINPPAYTKLDSEGNALDAGANDWAMVRDGVTGLIWEIKTVGDDNDIHYNGNVYRWQNIQLEFIMPLNEANFGGYSDWRLPTIKEYNTLVHNINVHPNPKISTTYFPRTMSSAYCSSNRDSLNVDNRWTLDFGLGGPVSNDETDSYYVRAVRGAHSTNRFLDNGDGTVTDTTTGLMWEQVNIEPVKMDWVAALNYCEDLVLAGHEDWRLPNIKELQSIIDYKKTGSPTTDSTPFPNTTRSAYWSSTTHAYQTGLAWYVGFVQSGVNFVDKTYYQYVRAVRGGN